MKQKSQTSKPRDRLAIFIKLEKRLQELAEELRLDNANNAAAEDVLAGPNFVPMESRFSIKN